MPGDRWSGIREARGKLADYIDALWRGQDAGPDELKITYTERLASAAKLSSLLDRLSSFEAARDILRTESKSFRRAFLATDHGRDARSKFNALWRVTLALEDHVSPGGMITTGPETLIEANLSSVWFNVDSVSLDFDGQYLHASCPIIVQDGDRTVRSGDDGFRDQLCDAIGQAVRSVNVGPTSMIVTLWRSRIELPFGEGSDPEPLVFTSLDKTTYIYR